MVAAGIRTHIVTTQPSEHKSETARPSLKGQYRHNQQGMESEC